MRTVDPCPLGSEVFAASFCLREARLDQVVFAGEGNFQISLGRIAKCGGP